MYGKDRGKWWDFDQSYDRRMAQVIKMLKFDEPTLMSRLASVSPISRVVFATACAERLAPAYRLFSNDRGERPRVLEHVLAHLWSNPDPSVPMAALESEIENVMGAIPQEDDLAGAWTQEATNAQNAGMALAYALRARLSSEAQEAVWAARVAYEAIDNFVINKEDIDTTVVGGEARVLSHRLVQAELVRQQVDLRDLEEASSEPQQVVIERIRQRARADAECVFECE